MCKYFILLIVFISLVNCQSIQKKSFENERGKNRTDRCMLREKNNCNGKKTVCQLHDKKGNEECRNEFDECVKKSVSKCKKLNTTKEGKCGNLKLKKLCS